MDATSDGPVLALTGDVMLGRLANAAAASRGAEHPWGDVLPLLRSADALLVNLECALTRRTEGWRDGRAKAFYFRGDPERAESLRVARVTFASLANNHAGDFGAAGLLETIRVLDGAGIRHAGAGATLEEARRPAVLTARGRAIAVVACADYPVEWGATSSRPGIHVVPVSTEPGSFAPVEDAIRVARDRAEIVVFSIHWGPNMRDRPTAEFRAFARRVIDAGATIFWGHSAHVVQGVEFHDSRLILYDAGDFVDDYVVDPVLRNDLTALFLARVDERGVAGLSVVPVRIAGCRAALARGVDREDFVRLFTERCAETGARFAWSDAEGSLVAEAVPSPP